MDEAGFQRDWHKLDMATRRDVFQAVLYGTAVRQRSNAELAVRLARQQQTVAGWRIFRRWWSLAPVMAAAIAWEFYVSFALGVAALAILILYLAVYGRIAMRNAIRAEKLNRQLLDPD